MKNEKKKIQEPLYNTLHYSMVLVITHFKDGPKSVVHIQIKRYRLDRKGLYMVVLLCNLNIFIWIKHGRLANMALTMHSSR